MTNRIESFVINNCFKNKQKIEAKVIFNAVSVNFLLFFNFLMSTKKIDFQYKTNDDLVKLKLFQSKGK